MRTSVIRTLAVMVMLGAWIALPDLGWLGPFSLRAGAAAAPLPSLSFRTLPNNNGRLSSAVADIDGDGWPEVLGTWNDKKGNLVTASISGLGLNALFSGGRAVRDNRLVDVNGDGLLDIVANSYACYQATNSVALLFINNGNRTFREELSFRAMNIRGRGETIVAADFDNDGDIDVFLPFYTFTDPDFCGVGGNSPRSYLLMNDGSGHFTDVSVSAGVSMPNVPSEFRPEGAQAVDINDDGFVDLYVGSHLFINNGNMTFTDRAAIDGLPIVFDEGVKFLDWNNDGMLDLLVFHPFIGPRLFQFNGTMFVEQVQTASSHPFFSSGAPLYAPVTFADADGVNVYDLNNDGLEDVVAAGGAVCDSAVFLNTGEGFERATVSSLKGCANGQTGMGMGDVDRDGKTDVFYPTFAGTTLYRNTTSLPAANRALVIEVLGPNGEKNQQGRVVRVQPVGGGVTYTRVVDGGSGYMVQTPYPILVGTPFDQHTAQVVFRSTQGAGGLVTVTFAIGAGQYAQVFAPSAADPQGHVVVMLMPKAGATLPQVSNDTVGVFRQTGGSNTFYLRNSNVPGNPDIQVGMGAPGDVPLAGDWNGDGVVTIGVYRPSNGTFYLRNSLTATTTITIAFGPLFSVPVVGDWDGNGTTTIGAYVPSEGTFYLRNSNSVGAASLMIQFGPLNSIPIVGDWDGNGTTTLGVYVPSASTFYLRNCNTWGFADIVVPYGAPGDVPVAGDYDRDGVQTIGVWRSADSTFYLRNANTPGSANVMVKIGATTDKPVLGDWDGK